MENVQGRNSIVPPAGTLDNLGEQWPLCPSLIIGMAGAGTGFRLHCKN